MLRSFKTGARDFGVQQRLLPAIALFNFLPCCIPEQACIGRRAEQFWRKTDIIAGVGSR